MEWIEVKLYSNINNFSVANRCSHQSIIYVDKLIILGGMNNNNFLGSSLFIINLDFSYYNEFKSNIEHQLIELSQNNNAHSKIAQIKHNFKLKELGIVNNINLPKIK